MEPDDDEFEVELEAEVDASVEAIVDACDEEAPGSYNILLGVELKVP